MGTKRFDLKGSNALITGAGGLLGFEHAMALLECDCDVILTDINLENLEIAKRRIKEYSFTAETNIYFMDITSEKSIIEVSNKIREKGNLIDILINNAALDPKVSLKSNDKNYTRLENFSLDQWNNELAVGITGAFLCSKIFGTIMAEELNRGCIVNIASDLSVIAPDQRLYEQPGREFKDQSVKPVTYSVIKSGLIGLTKYLSTYWNKNNVRCNALSPGGIFHNQNDEFLKKISERIPLSRMANRDEYRGAIQFLCSDAASYLNGHNLVVDGGRSIW